MNQELRPGSDMSPMTPLPTTLVEKYPSFLISHRDQNGNAYETKFIIDRSAASFVRENIDKISYDTYNRTLRFGKVSLRHVLAEGPYRMNVPKGAKVLPVRSDMEASFDLRRKTLKVVLDGAKIEQGEPINPKYLNIERFAKQDYTIVAGKARELLNDVDNTFYSAETVLQGLEWEIQRFTPVKFLGIKLVGDSDGPAKISTSRGDILLGRECITAELPKELEDLAESYPYCLRLHSIMKSAHAAFVKVGTLGWQLYRVDKAWDNRLSKSQHFAQYGITYLETGYLYAMELVERARKEEKNVSDLDLYHG